MADAQYGQGVPDALPQTSAPDDYQNVRPTAAAGLQQFGEGASKASLFFGQAAADAGVNDLMDFNTKTLYGDPTKPGPDGVVGSDTGYMGLKGQAALNARPSVEKALDDRIAQIRANLNSPEQQLQFDQYSRRYRNSAATSISSHAEQAASTWISSVNDDTAKLALDRAAQNADNPTELLHATSDLINARVKQAQLTGTDPSTIIADSKRDILKAQIQSIATTDPSRAIGILKKNQNIAGLDYAPLYDSLRVRADDQLGTDQGTLHATNALGQSAAAASASPTNPAQPVYQQVVAEVQGPYSPAGLARTVQIESGGRDVDNSIGMMGYGQFSKRTWESFGNGGSPHDLHDSVAAIQRYGAANAKGFESTMGRPPTDAESYIMHQQGGAGGLELMTNPNANASRLVGEEAIIGNGGTTSMSAGQFVAMWTHKFNGTNPSTGIQAPAVPQQSRSVIPPANPAAPQSVPVGGIPSSPDAVGGQTEPAAPPANPLPDAGAVAQQIDPADALANAYSAIEADPKLTTPAAKQKAFAVARQQISDALVASEATKAARKQAGEDAFNGYVSSMLKGQMPDMTALANDNRVDGHQKAEVQRLAMTQFSDTAKGQAMAYGDGFSGLLKQVTAVPGDPSKITDIMSIYRRVGDGLTVAGADRLVSMVQQGTRSVDDAAVHAAQSSLIQYAKSKISFDTSGMPNIPGQPQRTDAAGERLYNSVFVPTFLKGADDWIKAGKLPFDYLNKAKVDEIVASLRSPREMALARAVADSAPAGDINNMTAPPPPVGADPEGWKAIVNIAPTVKTGPLPFSPDDWARAVTALQMDPSPKKIDQFDKYFSGTNLSARDVLDILTPPGPGAHLHETLQSREAVQDILAAGVDRGGPVPLNPRPSIPGTAPYGR